MAVVTPTDQPKSVRNHCVIEVCVCFFEFSIGVRAFVIGPSQISYFFSWLVSQALGHTFELDFVCHVLLWCYMWLFMMIFITQQSLDLQIKYQLSAYENVFIFKNCILTSFSYYRIQAVCARFSNFFFLECPKCIIIIIPIYHVLSLQWTKLFQLLSISCSLVNFPKIEKKCHHPPPLS